MNSAAKADFESGFKTLQTVGKFMGLFLVATGAYFVYGGLQFMNIRPAHDTEKIPTK